MVRRRLSSRLALVGGLAIGCGSIVACEPDRDMPERMEMPDSAVVMEAMTDGDMRDSLLDVMPGGEMARGDSAASERLLKQKMEGTDP